jgi:hypothetical protein
MEKKFSRQQIKFRHGPKRLPLRAAKFADSVGIGSYRMDLHITTRGDHSEFGGTLPF